MIRMCLALAMLVLTSPTLAANRESRLAPSLDQTPEWGISEGTRGSLLSSSTSRSGIVRTLQEGEFQTREFTWNGLDDRGASVASGVYVIRATADGEHRIVKTALVR